MILINNKMTKKIKIHFGRKQLTPEEMKNLENGLEIKTTNIFGNPVTINGQKCEDGFRITETKQHLFFSIGMPIPDEDVCVYNAQGTLSTRIHNQKIIYFV